MSCERATVTAMNNNLVTFLNLRDGLVASRQEFERATSSEDTMNAGLMALRWTKATCDAFLSMTAAASSVLLPITRALILLMVLTRPASLLQKQVARCGMVERSILWC